MFSWEEMYIKTDSLQRRAEPAPRKGTLGNGPNLKIPPSPPMLRKGQKAEKQCRKQTADDVGQTIKKEKGARATG